MIASAKMIDIAGGKAVAEVTFQNQAVSEDLTRKALNKTYSILENNPQASCVQFDLEQMECCMSRLDKSTVLWVLSDSERFSKEDLSAIGELERDLRSSIEKMSDDEFRNHFMSKVDSTLRRSIRVLFLLQPNLPSWDKTGAGIKQLLEYQNKLGSRHIRIGPFAVTVDSMDLQWFNEGKIPEEAEKADIMAILVTSTDEQGGIASVVKSIRGTLPVGVLLLPSSDDQLEYTREIEIETGAELCDSVSGNTTHILLSILASARLTFMHPELALQRWRIDMDVDTKSVVQSVHKEPMGHQAFIIVDKQIGDAIYTYYYEPKYAVLERAPNVVAAISLFQIDSSISMKTEVFKTGDLNFVMIERDNLVFTLITGNGASIDELRETFSFLPDLYLDENPEEVNCTENLYTSPLFTLKLLATLPPKKIPFWTEAKRRSEPQWSEFQYPAVRDLLHAVWNALGRKISINQMAVGEGPNMTLGALHLLEAMKCIEFVVKIDPLDKPRKIAEPNQKTQKLYAQLDEILRVANGKNTVQEIARMTSIAPSVLVRVFEEMHRRDIIELVED